MLYTCILFDKIKYICVYLEDEATCSVYAMYFKTVTIYLIWRSRVLVRSGVKCISPIPLQVCDKHTTYILTRLAKYAKYKRPFFSENLFVSFDELCQLTCVFNSCYIKVLAVIWIVNRSGNNIIRFSTIIMKKVLNSDRRVTFAIKCAGDGLDIQSLIDGNTWYLRNNTPDIVRLNLSVF